MSLVVSTTLPSVRRILVADISTVTSLAGSSMSFWISADPSLWSARNWSMSRP